MKHADVIVVGAGPTGIAAATQAARHGRSVLLVDDNPAAGGQIWRGGLEAPNQRADEPENEMKSRALAELASSGAVLLSGYRVFDAPAPKILHALNESETVAEVVALQYDRLIVATGARERFLPFPGWTLPGVFGAGGLQALAKGGFSVRGKRVVVAGSGPLLLAVAAHLADYGAEVVCIAEQAPLSRLVAFGAFLLSRPAKIRQGIRYKASLGGSPYRTSCWPVSAQGDETTGLLRSVRFTDGVKSWDERCDLLACGFHLVPNTELAALLGCSFRGDYVEVDEQQQTSVADVYCAGEPTGIAGLEAALLQGEVAGLACAGRPTASLRGRSLAARRFAARLEKAFQIRPELRLLASPETIVCRCEDVPFQALVGRRGWTDAKLQTRCGMGPCQGRICGPAAQTLFGWTPKSVRPPLSPVPVSALCLHDSNDVTEENT